MRPWGLPSDLARMKLLVDSLIVFVVMLLAAGAIARGEAGGRPAEPSVTAHQEPHDATLSLIVSLLDWQ
jgi:hypothetical protein